MRFLTVLLAEDEPVISLHIQSLLEENELQVIQVTERDAITQAWAQFHPDLVILNYKQQDSSDGMTVAQALKQQFMLPVMFITGARPQDIASSKDFDSSLEILYKPFTRAQLRHCLQRHSA